MGVVGTMVFGGLFTAGGDKFVPPSINDFFPPAILFEGTPFEINRIILVRFVMVAAFVVISLLYVKRAKLVPGRAQNVMEMVLDFVRVNIAEDMLGVERGKRFTPLLQTIFFAAVFMNIAGVIPGLNIAGSSVIGLPMVLAAMAYIAFNYAGISEQGVGHYFKSQLFPPGAPKVMYLLLTPIEFLSNFIMRPVTLVLRLLINMVAGHFLLGLCLLSTNYFILTLGYYWAPLGVITLAGAVAFTFFEAFVAFLQAYIFALLTAAYIKVSVEAH